MPDLSQAYKYCSWITSHHYENFPVGSWLLPKEKRPFVAAIYAFSRAADDFADEVGKYEGRSLEYLAGWRKALWSCVGQMPEDEAARASTLDYSAHPIFVALKDTLEQTHIPVQLLDDLLTAFIMDVTKKRYSDWDDLMFYCKHSANPVGRLVLHLFDITDPEIHTLSDHVCSGLQVTNHWQDLARDWQRDMLYVPQDILSSSGIGEEDLTVEQAQSSKFRGLMQDLVARADALFDAGAPIVKAVQGGLRVELNLTVLGGRTILRQIEKVHYDVFQHRPSLSATDKIGLLLRAFVTQA